MTTHDETNGFRGRVEATLDAIKSQLTDMKNWTERHESEEFGFHSRVETSLMETARVLATSVEHRTDLARRIDRLELDSREVWAVLRSIKVEVTIIMAGLAIGNVVILPVFGWALWWIVNHGREIRP